VPVASGLTRPVFVTSPANDSRLFIVEQTGRVRVVHNGALLATPFLDLSASISCCGERGLLGLAFHPGYASNGFFYVNYTDAAGDSRVVRYRVSANADVADAASAETFNWCGLSMGGMETRWIALKELDTFSHIGLLSGGTISREDVNTTPNFRKKVKLVFVSYGSRELAGNGGGRRGGGPGGQPQASPQEITEQIKQEGVNAVFYVSPDTAHEFLSWRRSLKEMAPLLFKD